MSKGSMRDAMPITSAWIDDMRSAFGKEYIDGIIRRGMRGEAVFSASENGHSIGTPVARGVRIGLDAKGDRCDLDNPGAAKEPRRAGTVAWINSLDETKEE